MTDLDLIAQVEKVAHKLTGQWVEVGEDLEHSWLIVTPTCLEIGVGPHTQTKVIQRHFASDGIGVKYTHKRVVGLDGRAREHLCLRLDCLTAWLMLIQPLRTKAPQLMAALQAHLAHTMNAMLFGVAGGEQAAEKSRSIISEITSINFGRQGQLFDSCTYVVPAKKRPPPPTSSQGVVDDLMAELVPHFTDLRGDHAAIWEGLRNKERFMGDVRRLLLRAYIAYMPTGHCVLTGFPIVLPGNPPQEINGMIGFHHILGRCAVYENGWPMYRVENVQLYRRPIAPARYWTEREKWEVFKARYLAEHPSERALAQRIRIEAERNFARLQDWDTKQQAFEREG